MPRNNKRARRNARHKSRQASTTHGRIGPTAVRFAEKFSDFNIAQPTDSSDLNQERVWAKVENLGAISPEFKRSKSDLAARNWYDGRRRWESEDLRSLDTPAAIPWDMRKGKIIVDGRVRVYGYAVEDARRARIARGMPDFKSPERRLAGKPYTRSEIG